MAKKHAKSLTDDWIKQVVTGQRHKLAHMADGGEVPDWARGLDDEQLRSIGIERPAAEATPAPAAPAATSRATDYIPGDKGSTVDKIRSRKAVIDEASGYKHGGCVKRMEKGGEVDGPGTGTSDSIPAMLSDGEYVLPADTVDAVGVDTLNKLKAATHTPTKQPSMKGMVVLRADGSPDTAEAPKYTEAQWAIARHFYPNTTNPAQTIENARKEDPAALQRVAGEVGMPGAPKTPLQQSSALQFFNPTRVVSSAAPAQPAAPTSTATTVVDTEPLAPTPPAQEAPVAAAPKQATPKTFWPTMTSPNTAQDMVSAGRNLMNTQGIGGFVQAKGLNRMAQTINQTNEPLIAGQFGLQREAMNANERLEQAKLAETQRQQNQETWTPDKNMMGELVGYGRTKGGRPEYVTKESLMSKPSLAQFLAKAKPVNPKATEAELIAHYNATYAQND